MKGYSPTVQKTLALIDNDLAADLSLKNLAEAQKMSPAYLSSAFKRETGKTLTDYITSERMGLAAHLLETTNLQVQTVAAHCGILDVQYFSKLFKKHTKKTPKEYRESLK
jgi:YesN/AraC family two-component response regulator